MHNDVSYSLDKNLRSQIASIKTLIRTHLLDANVFLFGSIAKGRYSPYSDIDLLVLISEDRNTKELRLLRHQLEDAIECLKMDRKVDIKLYTIQRYKNLCEEVCFEQAIQQDLINLENW